MKFLWCQIAHKRSSPVSACSYYKNVIYRKQNAAHVSKKELQADEY